LIFSLPKYSTPSSTLAVPNLAVSDLSIVIDSSNTALSEATLTAEINALITRAKIAMRFDGFNEINDMIISSIQKNNKLRIATEKAKTT
jgi:hypothetical protein